MEDNSIVLNSIILSCGLLGSVYLMAESLKHINMYFIKKIPLKLFMINGFVFAVSSSIFIIYTFQGIRRMSIGRTIGTHFYC